MLSQTEPIFQAFWLDGQSLGDRAGAEALQDYIVGGNRTYLDIRGDAAGSIGLTLPLLSLAFLLYASFGQFMPDLAVSASRVSRSTDRQPSVFA